MSDIVITGASGGVGRALVNLFLNENWNVYALLRNKDSSRQNK